MAYDRTGTGPWAWLKAVGTQEDPLKPDWRVDDSHLLSYVWFSKHARSLRGGDLLVYYAAPHRVLPAIAEVVCDEVEVDDEYAPLEVEDGGAAHRDRWAARRADAGRHEHRPAARAPPVAHLPTPRVFQVARQLLLDAVDHSLAGVVETPQAA